MKVKLFSGDSPIELEKQINDWFLEVIEDVDVTNVQQYTIGQIDAGVVTISGQPAVKYLFCLLIFYR